MKLTEENLREWLNRLDIVAEEMSGDSMAYTESDEWWIETYNGCTPGEAFKDVMSQL